MSKFSILTACYNSGKFLKDWGESILQQVYRPLEVVLAIDIYKKDTDRELTRSLVKEFYEVFAENKIEFKVIESKTRLYCANCYELARYNATGIYFGILDSDDMLMKGAVEEVVSMYDKYPDVAYIYTQYKPCDSRMKKIKGAVGVSSHPGKYKTLLNTVINGRHGFSHWRTFSSRIKRPDKIFKPGLKCVVDKNMGFRLEEQGIGMFYDKPLYRYRGRTMYSVSTSNPTRLVVKDIIADALWRRKNYHLKIKPILYLKP